MVSAKSINKYGEISSPSVYHFSVGNIQIYAILYNAYNYITIKNSIHFFIDLSKWKCSQVSKTNFHDTLSNAFLKSISMIRHGICLLSV